MFTLNNGGKPQNPVRIAGLWEKIWTCGCVDMKQNWYIPSHDIWSENIGSLLRQFR